ncbi:unnamed protein product [Zymoseptoria tritici ST99CH_1A5]|uniref:Apple domain-containing protein n=1 Tax=Zymoseptoria tritici ST99CH_1A5 TaxID=1276529 RepID=A0A1Y6LY30_ZYMTR|nr:unnamed protein product [Zymoseptoria tritici ST99CH_1A5]
MPASTDPVRSLHQETGQPDGKLFAQQSLHRSVRRDSTANAKRAVRLGQFDFLVLRLVKLRSKLKRSQMSWHDRGRPSKSGCTMTPRTTGAWKLLLRPATCGSLAPPLQRREPREPPGTHRPTALLTEASSCGILYRTTADRKQNVLQTVPASSLSQCTAICFNNSKCAAYALSGGYCRTYSASVSAIADAKPTSQARFYDRACQICVLKAGDKNQNILKTFAATAVNQCTTQCLSSSQCKAYAFGYGYCRLYSAPVATVATPNESSRAVLYDRTCPRPSAVTTTTSKTSATTAIPRTINEFDKLDQDECHDLQSKHYYTVKYNICINDLRRSKHHYRTAMPVQHAIHHPAERPGSTNAGRRAVCSVLQVAATNSLKCTFPDGRYGDPDQFSKSPQDSFLHVGTGYLSNAMGVFAAIDVLVTFQPVAAVATTTSITVNTPSSTTSAASTTTTSAAAAGCDAGGFRLQAADGNYLAIYWLDPYDPLISPVSSYSDATIYKLDGSRLIDADQRSWSIEAGRPGYVYEMTPAEAQNSNGLIDMACALDANKVLNCHDRTASERNVLQFYSNKLLIDSQRYSDSTVMTFTATPCDGGSATLSSSTTTSTPAPLPTLGDSNGIRNPDFETTATDPTNISEWMSQSTKSVNDQGKAESGSGDASLISRAGSTGVGSTASLSQSTSYTPANDVVLNYYYRLGSLVAPAGSSCALQVYFGGEIRATHTLTSADLSKNYWLNNAIFPAVLGANKVAKFEFSCAFGSFDEDYVGEVRIDDVYLGLGG